MQLAFLQLALLKEQLEGHGRRAFTAWRAKWQCLRLRAFFTKWMVVARGMECASRPMLASRACTWLCTAAASASAFLLYVRCSCRYMSVVEVMSGIVPCSIHISHTELGMSLAQHQHPKLPILVCGHGRLL